MIKHHHFPSSPAFLCQTSWTKISCLTTTALAAAQPVPPVPGFFSFVLMRGPATTCLAEEVCLLALSTTFSSPT